MLPINYNIDVQSPFQAAVQGYQFGAGIRNDQQQQAQQQQALEVQKQQQAALRALMANPNPTAADYSSATLLIPGMKDQFKQAWEMRNTDQQQNDLSQAGQVYAALKALQPDVASQLLRNRAAALKNSGDEQGAKHAETMASVVDEHPDLAKTMIGMRLAAIPGGDKVIAGAAGLGAEDRAANQAPAALRTANAEATIKESTAGVAPQVAADTARKGAADADKARADAIKAQVEAGNAPTATVLSNEKAAQEIKASQLQGQIATINAQIAAANSETERGRLTLERDKLNVELQKLGQTQTTGAQDSMDALTQGLQTINSIKEHPGLNSVWGLGGVGSTTGKISGFIPGTDRKDLEGLVDTLKSQQFLAGVKQLTGMGSLSNAEGEKIGAAVASLNLDQSPQAFRNALGVIETNMNKAQSKLVARGNLPAKGEAYLMQHPKFGAVTEGTINAVMAARPGMTRDQVIQFMQQTGGR